MMTRTSTSRTVALASAVAFGIQVVFALLMLRLFSPEAVGELSLLSQIGFFWMTLALAQAPLQVLANAHVPLVPAARAAWRSSLLRGACLLPLVAAALVWSALPWWPALLWVLLLATCQMAWMLAQSISLRRGLAWQQATVRVLPPLVAAVAALLGAWAAWPGPTLVLSAVLGYAVGAAWLLPIYVGHDAVKTETHAAVASPPPQRDDVPAQSDTRSSTLRFAHTLTDALLATAVVVVWQGLYGTQDTGWMTALLRVLGFVPAVVHMAWAQVVLAQGHKGGTGSDSRPDLWLGVMAAMAVCALGAVCAAALHWQWLDAHWQGVWAYIVPLVLWQAGACVSAALSHRPFQTHRAATYSWACMAIAALQAVVLLVPVLPLAAWGVPTPDAAHHMAWFGGVSGLGLLGLALWMAGLRTK